MQIRCGRGRRVHLGAATALGLMLTAQAAQAQTTQAQTAPQEPVAQPPKEANTEIVVTAQRRKEGIQSVPISIQAYTAQQLNDLGVKSSSDLGQFTPNVSIGLPSGAGNQPIVTIRGIGLNDYDTNNAGPNGIYVDEVYLSAPASQTFQTFDLERVEVLKGPQGTLYGRNTSGGAINLVSAKPTDQLTGHLHIDYSSYNTVNIEGAVSGPIAANLTARIAFVENHSSGYVYNTFLNQHLGIQNYGVRAMLLYKPTSDLNLLFNVHGGQVNNPFAGYQHLGDFVPGTQYDASPTQCSVAATYANKCVDLFGYGHVGGFYDHAAQRKNVLRANSVGSYLRADYSPGDMTFTSISAIEHFNKRDDEDGDGTPNRSLEIVFGTNSTEETQEFRLGQHTATYNWVAGIYYLHEDLRQDQPLFAVLDGDKFFGPAAFDGVAAILYDTSRQITNSYAVYGQGEYNINDKLKMVLGARYTRERKSFEYHGSIQVQDGGIDNFTPIISLADVQRDLKDSAFNWRAGLNYSFRPGVMAYASVATGFKSGVFNGSFLSTDAAEINRQLQPVAPEKVTAYEVGLKTSFFDHRLVANIALFYNDYRNMQVFVLIPPVAGGGGFPVNVLDNARRAHTQGADISLTGKPVSGVTLTAQIGLLQARLDEFSPNLIAGQANYAGNRLPLAPKVSAELGAEWKIPVGGDHLNLQVNAAYKSQQYFDVSNDPYIEQPAYWITNLRAAYTFNAGRYEVAAFVHNLTGKKYYVDKFDLTGPFGFIEGIVGTPRMFGIEFNARY